MQKKIFSQIGAAKNDEEDGMIDRGERVIQEEEKEKEKEKKWMKTS